MKKFYYPRFFRIGWLSAQLFCKSYEMELASFENIEEVNKVFDLLNADSHSMTTGYVLVDGITLTPGSHDWYWTQNGRKISFSIPWEPKNPSGGNEQCLGMAKNEKNFNDIDCKSHESTFLCQKVKL